MLSEKRITIKEIVFAFLVSTLLLLICTKSSPLYPMNDWTDVNCIYIMGKAVNNGMVMYRDIFDHKGPVLYFIFAIADIISGDSALGLWIFEVICVAGFIFFTIQSSKLIVKNRRVVYFVLPFMVLFLLTSKSFTHGGSTEELALFPLSYSFYYFLRLSKDHKIHIAEHILNGVCFALVFWMKFTMVALYLGAYLFVVIYVLFKKETRLIAPTLYSALGFFAVSAAILLYFIANSALKDLWDVYFYGNIFTYTDDNSFVEKLVLMAKRVFAIPFVNLLFFLPIYVAFVMIIIQKKINMLPALITFFITMCLLYMGGARAYYPIVTAVYFSLGIWAMDEIYEKLKTKKILLWIVGILFYAVCVYTANDRLKALPVMTLLFFGGVFFAAKFFSRSCGNESGDTTRKLLISHGVSSAVIAANIILVFLMSFPMGNNTYLLEYEKEDMPQYKFAEIINAKEDATLLNYGFLDGGFYFASGVMPSNKYFYRSNLVTQEMLDEQDYLIENHKVDFVVTRIDSPNQKVIDAGYVCVAQVSHIYLGQEIDFFLYQLPSSN